MRQLAAEAVGRFGAMRGRGPGLSSWSAYTTMQRVSPQSLVDGVVAALLADGRVDDEARRTADRRVGTFAALVEGDARRRIAAEKGPDHVARVAVRPSIDRLDFTSARKADLAEMRREIYPLARRLATRMARERHARRRGPLDFRRTVRASVSTGGVPLTTHHKPKRPHRTELVVLCDVSGSVANFAQFTLMLVYALHEQFGKVRAFTFVDQVHEVTDVFRPGADLGDVMGGLAARTAQAALWGRTNYGRAFATFAEEYADALGPRSSLLILGDARSNYSDLGVDVLRTSRSEPGMPTGSTPSILATGTPVTRPPAPTARSSRWSSVATSPSSPTSSALCTDPALTVTRSAGGPELWSRAWLSCPARTTRSPAVGCAPVLARHDRTPTTRPRSCPRRGGRRPCSPRPCRPRPRTRRDWRSRRGTASSPAGSGPVRPAAPGRMETRTCHAGRPATVVGRAAVVTKYGREASHEMKPAAVAGTPRAGDVAVRCEAPRTRSITDTPALLPRCVQ